ncbi:MAG: polysaccharide deacetylase family protein, partial [Deltaproteobacteria bacterium]|nr:polysaccharide deacetylase family protein [Deltaproteobacteria bacterium]
MRLRSALRDRIGDLLYFTGVTIPGRRSRGKCSIVTFHRILPVELRAQYPLPGLCVTPEELRDLLHFFKRYFFCGTLRECAQGDVETMKGKPPLAITFDDAQSDNIHYAQPVLEAAQLRATFFVPTQSVEERSALWHDRVGFSMRNLVHENKAALGELLVKLGFCEAPSELSTEKIKSVMARLKSRPDGERKVWLQQLEERVVQPAVPEWAGMMSWDQMRELANAGHEIGSHSVSHPILPNCDEEQIKFEAENSKKVLEQQLGSAVDSFCYPNGSWDETVVQAVREAGY